MNWSPAGADGEYQYSATILAVFWPEAEHAKLIARWPHLIDQAGTSWEDHRKKVERLCVFAVDEGHTVSQTPADMAGFEEFLKDKRVEKPSPDDLRSYPDLRTDPPLVTWPPMRTAPCWCGSGRKYKQCCRPYGLGTTD
ncbi:SEC-C domain-containing protein [Amycolatopsis sp. NPDC051128]|uniref:SEC-C domain-containing protein n=1 Tax=Amycolatopsis sp. NPDC051128 TaxID=3155412 RepID=UPI00342EBB89